MYDYALIIADVMLERGLVIDLLHELQVYDDTAKLPILLCTTLAQRDTAGRCAGLRWWLCLDKTTLTPKMLREAVEHNILNGM